MLDQGWGETVCPEPFPEGVPERVIVSFLGGEETTVHVGVKENAEVL